MVGPKAKRNAADHCLQIFDVSKRQMASVLGFNRSTMSYKPLPSKDEELAKRMKELAAKHRRFGLPRIHYLLKREGAVQSKSRTERVYKNERLQLKYRRRKKQMKVVRVPFEKAKKPNEIWSFDFVSDRAGERNLRCLTIVDDCSKRTPGLLAEYSIPARVMINFFETFPKLPKKLRCDNGPEMSSREFMDWADKNEIEIEYIEPGKPVQNAYIESFNSRFRDECLNEYEFKDLAEAKKRIEKWRRFYNEERPHTAIGYKTPNGFEEEFN